MLSQHFAFAEHHFHLSDCKFDYVGCPFHDIQLARLQSYVDQDNSIFIHLLKKFSIFSVGNVIFSNRARLVELL